LQGHKTIYAQRQAGIGQRMRQVTGRKTHSAFGVRLVKRMIKFSENDTALGQRDPEQQKKNKQALFSLPLVLFSKLLRFGFQYARPLNGYPVLHKNSC